MKNLNCNDVDGNILNVGDKVVMLDTADLDGFFPPKGCVLRVSECRNPEDNTIAFNDGQYAFFGHRVLKLKDKPMFKVVMTRTYETEFLIQATSEVEAKSIFESLGDAKYEAELKDMNVVDETISITL
jgi:hypothetical protein